MKRGLLVTLALTAFWVVACSGENSSGADGESIESSDSLNSSDDAGSSSSAKQDPIADDGLSYTVSGSFVLNESRNMVILAADVQYENQCVVSDGEYIWKKVKAFASADTMVYAFRGDTLLFYNLYNGRAGRYAEMYVGWTNGKIRGTWGNTFCEYDREENEVLCDEESHYMTHAMNFGEETVDAVFSYHPDKFLEENPDGYMRTYFMVYLYDMLLGGDAEVFAPDIYDAVGSSYWMQVLNNADITIDKISKTSQTFTLGGKTYTATVERDEPRFSEGGDLDLDISITVKQGDTSCRLDYVKRGVTAELCKAENKDYLDLDYEMTDDDGNEYVWAYSYSKDNSEEYRACLESIAVISK